MFNLFNTNKGTTPPEWVAELQATQQRWFTFLEKLEVRMEELCTAAIPELKQLLQDDQDQYQQTFYKVQSGINGQMRNIRSKANDTYDTKVLDVYYTYKDQVGYHDQLDDFRNACSDRYHKTFEDKYNYWQQQLDKAAVNDYEVIYADILHKFEQSKNSFTCKQCGSPITIEKIFFISTYITCPACQTQNTFEPGSATRSLQHIARGLAEQRTRHLYDAYQQALDRERELYHANHELQLSIHFEKDKQVAAAKQQQVAANELNRQQAIASAPELNRQYTKAMFDEWKAITPDLEEHLEKMYQQHLALINKSV